MKGVIVEGEVSPTHGDSTLRCTACHKCSKENFNLIFINLPTLFHGIYYSNMLKIKGIIFIRFKSY